MVFIEGFTVLDEAEADEKNAEDKFHQFGANIQGQLDKFNDGPLVGVQYMVEVWKSYESKQTLYYLCSICAMKLTSTTLTPHLKSIPHKIKFTEIHCPELHEKFKTKTLKWKASEVKELTGGLFKVIKTANPTKMAVCTEDDKKEAMEAFHALKKGILDKMNTTTNSSENKSSNEQENKRSKSPGSLKGSWGSYLSSDPKSRDSKSKSSASLTKRSRSPSRSHQRTRSPPSKVSKNLNSEKDAKTITESEGRRSTRDKFASERTNFESQITLEPKPIKENLNDYQRERDSSPKQRRVGSQSRRRSDSPRRRSRSPGSRRGISPLGGRRRPPPGQRRVSPARRRPSPFGRMNSPSSRRFPTPERRGSPARRGLSPSDRRRNSPFNRRSTSPYLTKSECSEEIMVPQNADNFVGMMVGHRGSNISSMERISNCKISICGRGYHHSIMKCDGNKPLHVHIISDSRENVKIGVEKVLEAIDKATSKVSISSKTKASRLPLVEGDSEKIVQFPYDKYPHINFIELIKGDSGSNIIDIQRKTQTTLFVRGKPNSVSNPAYIMIKSHKIKDSVIAYDMINEQIEKIIKMEGSRPRRSNENNSQFSSNSEKKHPFSMTDSKNRSRNGQSIPT